MKQFLYTIHSILFIILTLVLISVSVAIATEDNRIIVTIPSQIAVKNDTFVLSDIANIVYNQPQQLEFAKALGAINLGKSPQRYDAKDLKGEIVLSAIESLGISRDAIGYHIPTHITITRATNDLNRDSNNNFNNAPLKSDELPLPANKKIPPLVIKGQPINVLYKSGLLTVKLNGVAMSSANESEILMVKNTRSNKIIKTRVINSEQAEVITE